jgi:penicillin-binding protein 2
MTRLKIINSAVILMFLILALGLLNLAVIGGRKYRDLSDKNSIRILPQVGARGNILDRRGSILVDNKISYDAMVLPQEENQPDKMLLAVSGVLGVSFEDLKETFRNGYVAPSLPVVIAKNIDRKKAIALEEMKFDFPSIIIHPRPVRHYPHQRLAAHVIGYVSEIDHWRLTKLADYGYKTKDIVGFGGVEEKYDYYLRQEEGGLSFQVDHRGRFVRVLGFRQPRQGRDIQLTLDLKIQKIAEEAMGDKKGCVIIMDPYSGEILAMASSPGFNPSAFVDKAGYSISELFSNPEAPLINRAISGLYPAGSVFKVIVATAGLETKKLNLSTSFLCQGSITIGKQKFSCWETHYRQNLLAAIAHSCNVFFYRSGLLIGAKTIHDYALKFGLSRPTSFELPYEAGGFVPSPLWRKINKFRNWFDGDTANLSIGQGDVLVTPLQIARMMAVFANKGYLVTPYIVKGIGEKDISAYQKRVANLHLKEDTINYMREGLREVVSDPAGTANILADLPVSVAGKTGTAQAPPGQPHAWFAGFFPFKNPRFVICVFIERGGPGYFSCLAAKQIIEAMTSGGLI